MTRLILLTVLILGAAGLSAEVVAEYNDDVELRDHETIRYRVDIDYGLGTSVDVDIYVRGLWAPPRVRVLDSRKKEVKDERDTSGDWILDFDFRAIDEHDHYYIEVDSAWPGHEIKLDVFLKVNAAAADDASATFSFNKFYFDNDNSDHNGCAASATSPTWALLPLGLFGALALGRRRRKLARQKA